MNQESLRCLLCRNARCSSYCPVNTNVPECMKLYREGKLKEAGEILFQNNPFSAITAQVCDWGKFCMGHCILNAKKAPIAWHEIEKEISDFYLFDTHFQISENNGKTVAIVGAGPSGISLSIWLAQAGYRVTLFDLHEKVGGVVRYGIPDFRLDRKYIDAYQRILEELGVEIKLQTKLGKDIHVSRLLKEYDDVILAVGATLSKPLQIPGQDYPFVLSANAFLDAPENYSLHGKVITIGAGNVAMDACRTAKRMGCDSYVYYRKTFENMPANPHEIEAAKQEGIQFEVFKAPVEVKENGVVFVDCKNEEENGRIVTKLIPGTEQFVSCDYILTAISQDIDTSLIDVEIKSNQYHYPEVDECNQTSKEHLYVVGDYILGASTVVECIESAKKVYQGIVKDKEVES